MNLTKAAWQRGMITLARSERLTHSMQGSKRLTKLTTRFIGGTDSASVRARMAHLKEQGISSSVYYLGEYVEQADLIQRNVQQILQIIEDIGTSGAELHVSVDPTQIGYTISDELGWQNAQCIAQKVAAQPKVKFMMIDMEDHTFVDKSLDVYRRLRAEGFPVAVTMQAYLHRTEADLMQITAERAAIRLVKGAFVENKRIAWTKKPDIDASYIRLAMLMLTPTMRERGVYPIFATHDDRIIDIIKPILKANGWQNDQYEFEMLLGVREPLQRQLVKDSYPLRLYVPFGTEWWPYTIRRIGESPANLKLVTRAILGW